MRPSPETIKRLDAYEFYAERDATGRPVWSHHFAEIKPVISWNNQMGGVTITYNAPLKKYLMCITDGWPGTTDMNTYLLESPKITGPWKTVTFMRGFGRQGYFSTFPSKFISADGRTAWLSYSANFHAIHRVAGVLRRRGGGRGGRSGRARFPARVVQQRRA